MKQIDYSFNMSPRDAARYVARNPYAWPGGYETALVMDDGGLICSKCVRENYRLILEHTRDQMWSGWVAACAVVIYPDDEHDLDQCAECNRVFT